MSQHVDAEKNSLRLEKNVYNDENNKSQIIDDIVKVKKISPIIAEKFEKIYINDSSSSSSISSLEPARKTQQRILMGIPALLSMRQKSSNEDAIIVHELVNDKYRQKLQHISRIYKRTVSHESSSHTSDEYYSEEYDANIIEELLLLEENKTVKRVESTLRSKENSYFNITHPYFEPMDNLPEKNAQNNEENAVVAVSAENSYCSIIIDNRVEEEDFLTELDLNCIDFNTKERAFSTSSRIMKHSISLEPLNSTENSAGFFSRANSFCSSIRSGLRRACTLKKTDKFYRERNNGNNHQFNTSITSYNSRRIRCQSLPPQSAAASSALEEEKLVHDLFVQNGIISQCIKALNYCASIKDSQSFQYIEAERILLVANCQKEILQDRINAPSSASDEGFFNEEIQFADHCGTLEISKLTFSIISSINNDEEAEAEENEEEEEYFVILAQNENKQILSSKILQPNSKKEIICDKTFYFDDLRTDFEIEIKIYSIKVSTDQKLNLNCTSKNKPLCLNAKKFFHLNLKSSRRSLLLEENLFQNKSSAFKLCGTSKIFIKDLEKTKFLLKKVPSTTSSSLPISFSATLKANVTILRHFSGFLTLAYGHHHLNWDHRFFVLDGVNLKSFYYPQQYEQFSSAPVGEVDLRRATENVNVADRILCSRPRTLCLCIKTRENTLKKYFLACDSNVDKENWMRELNNVICTLRAWKSLGVEELETSL